MENKNLLYGEITYKGWLNISNDILKHQNSDSVFLDIGSGYGKGVELIAEFNKIQSIGIEIDIDKLHVSQKIVRDYYKRTNLVYGNIFEREDLIKKSNFIFANNIAFDQNLNDYIFDTANENTVLYFSSLYNRPRNLKDKQIVKSFFVNYDFSARKIPLRKIVK